MGIFGGIQREHGGFTIVELMVVIVVIGILAGIVIVTYPGYQQRTRDNERKSDLGQIAAALGTYAFQKNTVVTAGSGCGRNGNGNGWLSAGAAQQPGVGVYPRSIVDCLRDIGAAGTGAFVDPSGCTYSSGGSCGSYGGTPTPAYMKATCTKAGVPVTYVFAYLETAPQQDAQIDALCDAGSVNGFDATNQLWGTNYGMNYYVTVK